jgi:hypothetical protein
VRFIVADVSKPYRIREPRKPGSEWKQLGPVLTFAISRRRFPAQRHASLENSIIKSEISGQRSEIRKIEDLQAALAQFAAVTDAMQRLGFPIANDLEKSK